MRIYSVCRTCTLPAQMALALKINPSDLQPTARIIFAFIVSMASVLAGTYAFLYGLRALRRSRYLRNVPRSKIRSAAIGPVELCGTAPRKVSGTCLRTSRRKYTAGFGVDQSSRCWEQPC
jgi:hypothetical protein